MRYESGSNEAYLAGVPTYSKRGGMLIPMSVPVARVRHVLMLGGAHEWEKPGDDGFLIADAGADELDPDYPATLIWYVGPEVRSEDEAADAYESPKLPDTKRYALQTWEMILKDAGLEAALDRCFNGWDNWVLCVFPAGVEEYQKQLVAVLHSKTEQEWRAEGL